MLRDWCGFGTSVPIASGGTGATTAAAARTALGAVASGDNSDITSITGLTTKLAVNQGGTGVGTITGLVKGNGTSAFTAAVAGDFPTLNQSTTGNALTATTAANGGVTSVNGATGEVSVTADSISAVRRDSYGYVGEYRIVYVAAGLVNGSTYTSATSGVPSPGTWRCVSSFTGDYEATYFLMQRIA